MNKTSLNVMHPNLKIRGLEEAIIWFKWLGLKTAVGMALNSDKSKPKLIMNDDVIK